MFRRLGLLAVLGAVSASPTAAASSLQLQLSVAGSQPEPVACPANASPDANCSRLAGTGIARGLGRYQASAVVVRAPRTGGGFDSTITGSLQAAGGTLAFTGDNRADPAGKLGYAISLTGSGDFATVAGTGSLVYSGILAGNGSFLLDATLDPASVFDLSPPTLTLGAVSARSLGGGRYALAVHYRARDTTAGPLTYRLTTVGVSKALAAGAASTLARATVHVRPGTHRLVLRLTVTDGSANATTRTVSAALP